MTLKIDGRSYSPRVLKKAMFSVSNNPAYHLAAENLQQVGDIQITGRHLRNLTVHIGGELEQDRDDRTQRYFEQPLPRVATEPATPMALACVSVDGGRMQTRLDGGPNGVQQPHWRETKNALFLRMTGVEFETDPHPELPACFADRRYMKNLLSGVAEEDESQDADAVQAEKSDFRSWRPERVYRTCLSSLRDSDSFGRMMEAEADARGFFKARKQAFVSDGLPYNWTLHKRHFPAFVPILDFPHAIERVYEAARAATDNADAAWWCYVRWARACWQGRVQDVLDELHALQRQRGEPPQSSEEKDQRNVLAETVVYLTNNQSKMDYSRYRREGLPTTSAYMESLVKEINYRVKGTEKFWNDGPAAEAILALRAAALCDDNRLGCHLGARPGNPFRPNVKATPAQAA